MLINLFESRSNSGHLDVPRGNRLVDDWSIRSPAMGIVVFVGLVPQNSVYFFQMLNDLRICIENVLICPRFDRICEISSVIYRHDLSDFDPVGLAGDLVVFTESWGHVNDPSALACINEISGKYTKGIVSFSKKIKQRFVISANQLGSWHRREYDVLTKVLCVFLKAV